MIISVPLWIRDRIQYAFNKAPVAYGEPFDIPLFGIRITRTPSARISGELRIWVSILGYVIMMSIREIK